MKISTFYRKHFAPYPTRVRNLGYEMRKWFPVLLELDDAQQKALRDVKKVYLEMKIFRASSYFSLIPKQHPHKIFIKTFLKGLKNWIKVLEKEEEDWGEAFLSDARREGVEDILDELRAT